MSLPSEIWTQIFHLAADEDEIFRYELPISLDTSIWTRNTLKDKLPQSDIQDWTLKTPSDILNALQRRSYATKKVRVPLVQWSGWIPACGFQWCRLWPTYGRPWSIKRQATYPSLLYFRRLETICDTHYCVPGDYIHV